MLSSNKLYEFKKNIKTIIMLNAMKLLYQLFH